MAGYTADVTMTAIFTPPAACSSHWTYESEQYNSVDGGLLIQNALSNIPDTPCFPPGFLGFGRTPSNVAIYSPGACPVYYATAANSINGAVTTAICCPSSFSYRVSYSSISSFSTSELYAGCISMYPSNQVLVVRARRSESDLNTTIVTGPITMWAQPVSVAFQTQDMTLFTTTTTSSSNSIAPSSTSTPVPQTSASASSATSITTPIPTSAPSKPSLSSGTIAGISIGCAAILGLVIGLAIFFRRKGSSSEPHDDPYSTYPADAKYAPSSAEGEELKQFEAELDGNCYLIEMPGEDILSKHPIPTSPIEVE